MRCSESAALAIYPNTTIPMGLVNCEGTLDVSQVTVTVSPDCHTVEAVGLVIGGSKTSRDKRVGRA